MYIHMTTNVKCENCNKFDDLHEFCLELEGENNDRG